MSLLVYKMWIRTTLASLCKKSRKPYKLTLRVWNIHYRAKWNYNFTCSHSLPLYISNKTSRPFRAAAVHAQQLRGQVHKRPDNAAQHWSAFYAYTSSYLCNHLDPMSTYSRPHIPQLCSPTFATYDMKLMNWVLLLKATNEVEVCCVTETWLYDGMSTETKNSQLCWLYRRDRSNDQTRGGVICYVKNNWPSERLCSLEPWDVVAASTWTRDASSHVPYFTWHGLPSARSKQSTSDWSHYRMHRQDHSTASICWLHGQDDFTRLKDDSLWSHN